MFQNSILNNRFVIVNLNSKYLLVILCIFLFKASTCSYVSTNWNGRMVEQEICTKKLRNGLTEKVIVMKDGNQSCITTITENPKTGVQNFKKQLINLDESNYYCIDNLT